MSRAIPSFHPLFAGKCDRQSRDLTQFTCGYISRLYRLLVTPDHHVRTPTNYCSKIIKKIFFKSPMHYSQKNRTLRLRLNQDLISGSGS